MFLLESVSLSVGPLDVVTRPRLWLKTTSEKGPHLSCVVFTKWPTQESLKNTAHFTPVHLLSADLTSLLR